MVPARCKRTSRDRRGQEDSKRTCVCASVCVCSVTSSSTQLRKRSSCSSASTHFYVIMKSLSQSMRSCRQSRLT